MKKYIAAILALIILSLFYVFLTNLPGGKKEIANSSEAINLIKNQNPELKDFPSGDLPPKRIETAETENGWQVGFYTEGSGRPGILRAKCYEVTRSGTVKMTGEFSAGPNEGASTIDLSSCKEAVATEEASLTYFTDSVILKAKSLEDYEGLGLGGKVDGFTLRKAYPGLLPADFEKVNAYQGSYSVEDGELLFTGNAASNSAVLEQDGMRTLLNNVSRRLEIPLNTEADVDRILRKLEEK